MVAIMSTPDRKKVTIIETRLSNLRHGLRISWGELAEELQISRAMLTYIRNGDRGVSPSIEARIEELEVGVYKNATECTTIDNESSDNHFAEVKSLREQLKLSQEREKALLEIIKNLSRNGV